MPLYNLKGDAIDAEAFWWRLGAGMRLVTLWFYMRRGIWRHMTLVQPAMRSGLAACGFTALSCPPTSIRKIRFTQATITPYFKNGYSVEAALFDTITARRWIFPPIRLYWRAGRWYALDNRRLFLAKLACDHGYLGSIPVFPLPVQADAAKEFGRKWEDDRRGLEVKLRYTEWRSGTFPTAGLRGGCRWLNYPVRRPPEMERGRSTKQERTHERRHRRARERGRHGHRKYEVEQGRQRRKHSHRGRRAQARLRAEVDAARNPSPSRDRHKERRRRRDRATRRPTAEQPK